KITKRQKENTGNIRSHGIGFGLQRGQEKSTVAPLYKRPLLTDTVYPKHTDITKRILAGFWRPALFSPNHYRAIRARRNRPALLPVPHPGFEHRCVRESLPVTPGSREPFLSAKSLLYLPAYL